MCWKHSKHSVVSMGELFSARTRSSVSWRCCAEAIRSALAEILSGCSLAAAAAGLKYPVFLPLAAAIRHKTDPPAPLQDRKSTRLNSSHVKISYAVFCLKKKTKKYR